jgi:hypothetical protein
VLTTPSVRSPAMLPFLASLFLAMSGCHHLGFEPRLRLAVLKASWTAGAGAGIAPHLHERDYWLGWRAGYYEIASGGQGLPPPVPPQRYWDVTGAPETRQTKIDEWYRGFAEGVSAAGNQGLQDAYVIPGRSVGCTETACSGVVDKGSPTSMPPSESESMAPIALATHTVSEETTPASSLAPSSQLRLTPRVRRGRSAEESSPGLLAALREMYFEPNGD